MHLDDLVEKIFGWGWCVLPLSRWSAEGIQHHLVGDAEPPKDTDLELGTCQALIQPYRKEEAFTEEELELLFPPPTQPAALSQSIRMSELNGFQESGSYKLTVSFQKSNYTIILFPFK